MSDNLTPELESQATPDEIDLSSIPDQLPVEDVKGLKSALEKLKQQVTELKGYKSKAQILDELTQQGIDPKEIPNKLKEIERAQQVEKELERLKAEAEAQFRIEKEQLQKAHQETVSGLQAQIKASQKRSKLEEILSRGGGAAADYEDFAAAASRYLEFDAEDPTKVTRIRPPHTFDGDTWYVDDGKGGVRSPTIEDFLIKAKNGEYGKALQAVLPPLNQASGAGIPGVSGLSPDMVVLKESQLQDISKLTPEQLAKVKAGKYTLIKG